ncbi:hypothetical protein VPH35_075691 [Triticum aestivum]
MMRTVKHLHYPCSGGSAVCIIRGWIEKRREAKKPTNCVVIKGREGFKRRPDKKQPPPSVHCLPQPRIIHPSVPVRHGAHAQPGRDLPPRRHRQAHRHRRRHAKPPLHHHQRHRQRPPEQQEGGGDGGHPGGLRRAGPVPGGDREQLRGEDAGQRGHAAPHPHPHALRALPLPRPARSPPGAALRGGRPQAALQGRRMAPPLPRQGRLRRAQARVRLEGPRPGLRRRAHRQDRQGARRRRPCPRRAPLRAAQPSQGTALHALRRWAERQRLHHRGEDRPDQDQRSPPKEEGLGMLIHGVLFLFLCIAHIHSFVSWKVCSSTASV